LKRFISLGIAALALIAGSAVLGAGPASAVVTCTGLIANTTVPDTVIVPNGVDCTISNSTISGSVIVQSGGALFLQGSTVNGYVNATNPRWIRIDALGPCTVAGDPTSCQRRTIIAGSLTVSGTTGTPPGFLANYICNGTYVGGNATISNSTASAPWAIGSTNVCSFGGNTFNGSLTIDKNAARVDVANNTVKGNLKASNNTGGGDVSNNTIGGSLSFINNCPPYTYSGNTATGTTSTSPCTAVKY
jgi:hypothetical protein